MEAYWPQRLAEMVDDYERLEKRIEEYKKDNELLSGIRSQNLELRQLLERKKGAGQAT